MSIQSSINATVGAITGAAILAKKNAMDKAKAAQAELEKEKKLQMKRSEAAANLAQARVEQDQKEKQRQFASNKFETKILNNRNEVISNFLK